MSEETNNMSGQSPYDVFNLNPEAFVTPPKKGNMEIYQPAADKGKGGVYKSLIRFLPNIRNLSKSKVSKYYVWLTDPMNGESFSVDCPSTVGKKSILKDLYWKLAKSGSAHDQEVAKQFSRAASYYSLVQIVKDENQPELEGKIMVFKFGIKINEKLDKLMKPEAIPGQPAQGCNPYDLLDGKLFMLHITKKMEWNNYDNCEFVGERCPLQIDGKPIQRTPEDQGRVVAWLTDNSPDLEKYDYRDWDDQMTSRVMQIIRTLVPDQRLVDELARAAQMPPSAAPAGGFAATPSPAAAHIAPPPAAQAQNPVSEPRPSSGSVEDLYANL